jgi:DNA excision repair protein ERCC-3
LEAVSAFAAENDTPRSGILVADTGWGKTLVAIELLRRTGKRGVVVTVGSIVLYQWLVVLKAMGVSTGVVGAEEASTSYLGKGPLDPPTVTLLTYQMLSSNNGRRSRQTTSHMKQLMANCYGTIVFDEVHVLPAPTYRAAVEELRVVMCEASLGLTATLLREDGGIHALQQIVGPVMHRATAGDAANRPTMRAHVCRVPMPTMVREAFDRSSGFKRRLLAATNPAKVAALVASLDARKTIVFVSLHDALPQVERALLARDGPTFGPLSGMTSQVARAATLNEFRASIGGVLLITDIGSLGLDVPDVEVICEMTTDVSRTKCMQRWGRALRMHEGKTAVDAFVFVSMDTHEDHTAVYRSSEAACEVTVRVVEAAVDEQEQRSVCEEVIEAMRRRSTRKSAKASSKGRKVTPRRPISQILKRRQSRAHANHTAAPASPCTPSQCTTR